MTIALTDEQAALAAAVAEWAGREGFPERIRAAEACGEGIPLDHWSRLAGLGVPGIAVPESFGGGGGKLGDLACALESAAAGLVPGPLLSTAVGAALLAENHDSPAAKLLLPGICQGSVLLALAPEPVATLDRKGGVISGRVPVVMDAGSATHLVLGVSNAGVEPGNVAPGRRETWLLLPVSTPGVEIEVSTGSPDLSRTVGSVELDQVSVDPDLCVDAAPGRVFDLLASLAAAEASGTAQWALGTAVEHAKVREQFGRPIGAFQAVKHLCARMLERAESATAVAWGAAAAEGDPEQLAFASAVAAAVAPEVAVANAEDCIQVLGGIGFTWEHDAHLHLRRALSSRQMLGGANRARRAVATLALDGVRRTLHVETEAEDPALRESIRADVDRVRAAPERDRRALLADTGLLAPHWPRPYGRAADPRTQLVIDEELAAAGISRPDLAVGAWAAPTILKHGTPEQQERFVPATLRGGLVWCQLFSEPGAGSDLAALRTRAERVDGGWSVTGQKVWTSLAQSADWAICLARTDPDRPRHQGITYFLVDMRSEGIEVRPLREITGQAVFNEVFLDAVFVPDEQVVGEVHGGWRLARTTLSNERVAMSGSSLGVSVERALSLLGSGPSPSEVDLVRVGSAVAEAVTVASLGARSTLRALNGAGPGAESSVQKLLGVMHRQDAAELVYDLLGPSALADTGAEPALHEVLLTRCLSIAGGTTQVLRNVAAERILGLPRD